MEEVKAPLYKNLAYEGDVIRLAQNENPYGASPRVMDAIIKNIHSVSLYPDVVLTSLKEKLAKMNQVSPAEINISAGSVSLIDQLISRMVKADENIVIPQVTFVAYKLCADIHFKECRIALMDHYHIDLDAILKLSDAKTKLIFLSNPNNPTGTILSHQQIIDFLEKVPRETYVILDEAYTEYVERADFPDYKQILKQYANVIILRSFSKVFGLAGLRIGYAIAQQAVIQDLETNRIPFTITTLSNFAALEAVDDQEHVAFSVKHNAIGRDILLTGLRKLGYNVLPSESNFVFIYFETTQERDALHDRLFANKIIVRKMEAFGDARSLRISVGKVEENAKIIECLSVPQSN